MAGFPSQFAIPVPLSGAFGERQGNLTNVV